MTDENLLAVLDALDQRVGKMVDTIKELEMERDILREEVEQSNKSREELDNQLHSVNGNNKEVKTRIQSILDKLEQLQTD